MISNHNVVSQTKTHFGALVEDDAETSHFVSVYNVIILKLFSVLFYWNYPGSVLYMCVSSWSICAQIYETAVLKSVKVQSL